MKAPRFYPEMDFSCPLDSNSLFVVDGIFDSMYVIHKSGLVTGAPFVNADSTFSLLRLPNGNVLINAGDSVFEVNPSLSIVASYALGLARSHVMQQMYIPLLLSLDLRPELGIIGYNDFTDNFDFDIALGIRYQF